MSIAMQKLVKAVLSSTLILVPSFCNGGLTATGNNFGGIVRSAENPSDIDNRPDYQ